VRPSRLLSTKNEAAELSAEGAVDERLDSAGNIVEAPFANRGYGSTVPQPRIGADEPQPGYFRALGIANLPPCRLGTLESTYGVSIRARSILSTPGDRGSCVFRAGQRRYERGAEDAREMADKVGAAGRGHGAILFWTRPTIVLLSSSAAGLPAAQQPTPVCTEHTEVHKGSPRTQLFTAKVTAMELEITVTPRETLVWATKAEIAQVLRRELDESGYLVRDADPFDLTSAGLIPEGEHLEFDPARIFDVGIGPNANASLHALVDSGHSLVWHRWQTRLARKVWGVPVAIPRKGRPRAVGIERATHFGTKVRGQSGLGLRISRDAYATINKRSSMPRWSRDDNSAAWDRQSRYFDDDEHRILTDEWCEAHQADALANFDMNMAHFASLDPVEFTATLQLALDGHPDMVEVTDLTEWDGVPGVYVMVLDEYRQLYVGATSESAGIAKRIRQHWTNQKEFDRLIFGSVETSILSIDSFRALDTTRIFAMMTGDYFNEEISVLAQFPPKFALNRFMGGNDAVRFAGLLGIDAVMRTREIDPERDVEPKGTSETDS
jgi:hypothetical protein